MSGDDLHAGHLTGGDGVAQKVGGTADQVRGQW
jgi:hypothetical protein